MPAYSDVTTALDRQLLAQLGDRLKRTRIGQGLTTVALAQRVGISRTTLGAVEAGDPTPTMGTYVRVMSALGVSVDLALLVSGVARMQVREPRAKTEKRVVPVPQRVVAAGDALHELQDLQSLMLHKEAIRLMQERPELVQQAVDTLDKWRSAGNSRSRFIWDEWSVILHRKTWRKALGYTSHAKQLRQASPLPTVLPPDVRQRVLDQMRELKRGVDYGQAGS